MSQLYGVTTGAPPLPFSWQLFVPQLPYAASPTLRLPAAYVPLNAARSVTVPLAWLATVALVWQFVHAITMPNAPDAFRCAPCAWVPGAAAWQSPQLFNPPIVVPHV